MLINKNKVASLIERFSFYRTFKSLTFAIDVMVEKHDIMHS